MAYSKAYQTVIAGRVREDELAFFKSNSVASPARVFSLNPIGGKKQPTIDKDYMHDTGMGKKTGRDPVLSAFNPNGNNIG